jgi:hypothetical protein
LLDEVSDDAVGCNHVELVARFPFLTSPGRDVHNAQRQQSNQKNGYLSGNQSHNFPFLFHVFSL